MGLITTTEAREYLALDTGDADTILASLVEASSAWVESQIGRPVLSATYTETHDGTGRTRLLLDKWPVTSVTSVTVDGVAVPARPAVSAGNPYPEGWVLRENGIDLVGYEFTVGLRNVTVVYVAGYATVPEAIKQATKEHVALKYRRRTNLGQGSANTAGDLVTYSDAGVVAGINDLLDPYRVIVAR